MTKLAIREHVFGSITSVTTDLDHRSRSARQPEVPANRYAEFVTETVTSVTETVTHVCVRASPDVPPRVTQMFNRRPLPQ